MMVVMRELAEPPIPNELAAKWIAILFSLTSGEAAMMVDKHVLAQQPIPNELAMSIILLRQFLEGEMNSARQGVFREIAVAIRHTIHQMNYLSYKTAVQPSPVAV
jgi:hypothetical protein